MLTAALLASGLLAILQLAQHSRGPQPSCRKSSALSVLELPAPTSLPSVVVWSGKGPHGADDMLDGLFAFDLQARKWQALQDDVLAGGSTQQLQQPATTLQQHASSSPPAGNLTRSGLPSPRWKELTATLPEASSMLLFAGDDVESSREVYKNDVWMLRPMGDAEGHRMVNMLWQQGSMQGGQSGGALLGCRACTAASAVWGSAMLLCLPVADQSGPVRCIVTRTSVCMLVSCCTHLCCAVPASEMLRPIGRCSLQAGTCLSPGEHMLVP